MTAMRRLFTCAMLVLVGAAPVFILFWDERPDAIGFAVALLGWSAIAFGVSSLGAFKRAGRDPAFTRAIRTSLVAALLVSVLPPFRRLEEFVGIVALDLMEACHYIELWFESSGPRLNTFSTALTFGWLVEIQKACAFCLFTALAWLVVRTLQRPQSRGSPETCVVCGYDLRASPERCPECGTPRPEPAARPSRASPV